MKFGEKATPASLILKGHQTKKTMPSTKKLSIAAAVGLLLLEVAGASCPFEFTFEKITVS